MDPKLNFFVLAYSDYDTYEPFIFYHENRTKQEFKKDVDSLLVKYGHQLLAEKLIELKKKDYSNYISVSTWIEFILDKLPELGYIRILPHNYCFNDEQFFQGHGNFEFEKVIGKKLLNKTLSFNNKVSEVTRRLTPRVTIMRKLETGNGIHRDEA